MWHRDCFALKARPTSPMRRLPDPGLPSLWVEAEQLFADDRPLLAYVRHCGELLSQVLRGNESPLETLFPGGSFELAQDLYERSQAMRYVNALVANAFESLGAYVSEGRTLRVLEVGAGTGGTTAALLSVLPPDRTSYLFTDVSDVFLDRARQRFGSYPFLTFGRLDLDKDLATQGYLPGSFDVIVSANAVHASTDLRLALRRLHDLLAPGGLLILVEFHDPLRLVRHDDRTDRGLAAFRRRSAKPTTRCFPRQNGSRRCAAQALKTPARGRSPIHRRLISASMCWSHAWRACRRKRSARRLTQTLAPIPRFRCLPSRQTHFASASSMRCRRIVSISCATSCASAWFRFSGSMRPSRRIATIASWIWVLIR